MTNDRISQEQEALRSLMDLLDRANECRRLHERAGMGLPEPLKRILGIGTNGTVEAPRVVIPPPEIKDRPPEADSDWVRISVKDAMPASLVLALLRGQGHIPVRDVVSRVIRLLPDASPGSIANIGTRFDSTGDIERTDEGWKLMKQDRAGVLHTMFLWGPADIFGKHELAAHRRDAILHVLGFYQTGLQTLQLVERLRGCDWIKAPVNKDLVKADMLVLQQEKKVKRRGNTKKWDLVEETE